MTDPMFYIDEMIEECEAIIQGDYGEDEQRHIDDLMTELRGFGFQLRITGAPRLPENRTREGVLMAKGWLAANKAALTMQQAPSITNNNQSSATASASATVKQTVKRVKKSSLSQEDKDALELALARMRSAAEEKDEKGFADKLKKALDIASRAVGLVPTVVQAAGSLASAL